MGSSVGLADEIPLQDKDPRSTAAVTLRSGIGEGTYEIAGDPSMGMGGQPFLAIVARIP